MAVDIDSARPADVTLIEPLLDQSVTPEVPGRLIYDRAADSDPLRERLAAREIELICPHRRGCVRPATQDGRPLRRYRKRCIVERTISWLQSFTRLVTRFYSFLYHGFATLRCLMIVDCVHSTCISGQRAGRPTTVRIVRICAPYFTRH